MNRHLLALILTVLVLSFASLEISRVRQARAAPTLREDTAQLNFVKTAAIRSFKNKQVLCENYIVKEGDYIWKILRRRGHGSPAQLVHWSKVLRALNPGLKDLNKIYPGQQLVVPLGFRKEAVAKKPAEISSTTYEVKPGETLSGILHRRFHLPEKLIFNEALDLVRKLNPQLRNLNRIHPGQRLVIPLFQLRPAEEKQGLQAAAAGEPTIPAPGRLAPAEKGKGEKKPAPESGAGPTEVVIETRRPTGRIAAAPGKEEGAATPLQTRLAPPVSPEEQRLEVLADAIMAVVIALGGRCQITGSYFLPLKGQGQVSLKASSFPLLEFPTGERIFLDLNDRLPPSLEEAINLSWQGRYGVVNVTESDNFRAVWQRLIEHLTRIRQWLDRKPLVIKEPPEMAIRGDWVLILPTSEANARKIFVINLLTNHRERTDLALQAYLDERGVRVVDVELRGQLERARITAPLDEKAFLPQPPAMVSQPASAAQAVEAFLKLLGVSYQRNAVVPLYSEGEREVRISVRAGFYFHWMGESHLIDLQVLSAPILRLLAERQQQILVIDPHWSPLQVFKALVKHLNLKAEKQYEIQVSSRDAARNTLLRLPGYFIRNGEHSYLLTPVAVPASLADFLSRKGVRTLSYASR